MKQAKICVAGSLCVCPQSLSNATPWTAAHQAPLTMGFSSQEHWSELPCPPPGDLPNPGIKLGSPALQADSLPDEPSGKPDTASSFSQRTELGNRYMYIHTHTYSCVLMHISIRIHIFLYLAINNLRYVRPARRQARLPHSRSLLLPGRER